MKRDNRSFAKTDDFEERVIQLKRVSKKTKGGNTIAFAALVVVGDKNGKVGVGYGKASDVSSAMSKAMSSARKEMINVTIKNGTITHPVENKYGSAKVLLMPAPKGAGIIAGGVVRTVLELAGMSDISSKMLGSNNKMCNIRCALEALQKVKE
jgi:small subunit ribosomal protein S5